MKKGSNRTLEDGRNNIRILQPTFQMDNTAQAFFALAGLLSYFFHLWWSPVR
jgi:hypothetical protein